MYMYPWRWEARSSSSSQTWSPRSRLMTTAFDAEPQYGMLSAQTVAIISPFLTIITAACDTHVTLTVQRRVESMIACLAHQSLTSTAPTYRWRRGVVVSGVRRMNEVNARRARLVPGWVTVFGRVYHLGM